MSRDRRATDFLFVAELYGATKLELKHFLEIVLQIQPAMGGPGESRFQNTCLLVESACLAVGRAERASGAEFAGKSSSRIGPLSV